MCEPFMARSLLENDLLKVTAERDGTLTLLEKSSGIEYRGLNRFADAGDAGDEYNFSPPGGQAVASSTEAEWTVEPGDRPYTFRMRGDLNLPRALTEDRASRSQELVLCPAIVTIRLLPGSRRVEINTEFYNRVRDHRLRAVFPSGMEAESSVAETAFGTVRRPTKARDSTGWREQDSATYAQRRFVCVEDAGRGLAILNKGLPEYEVTPNGDVNLTLLRSVGWLSRSDLAVRKGHAGPEISTPEAQCPGRHSFDYAIVPYSGDWQSTGIYREAEEFWLPLEARAVQREELSEPVRTEVTGSFIEVSGDGVVLSALKKAIDKDGIILRLFNTSREVTEAQLHFGVPVSVIYRVNLNEDVIEEVTFKQSDLSIPLEGASIGTFLVKFAEPGGPVR